MKKGFFIFLKELSFIQIMKRSFLFYFYWRYFLEFFLYIYICLDKYSRKGKEAEPIETKLYQNIKGGLSPCSETCKDSGDGGTVMEPWRCPTRIGAAVNSEMVTERGTGSWWAGSVVAERRWLLVVGRRWEWNEGRWRRQRIAFVRARLNIFQNLEHK